MVLFFRRADCGLGPLVDAPRLGPLAGGWLAVASVPDRAGAEVEEAGGAEDCVV